MAANLKISVLMVLLFVVGSCAFSNLSVELERLNATSVLRGTIELDSDRDKPILIALYRKNIFDEFQLETYTVLYGPGDFVLHSEPGNFYLIAFEDLNEDFTLQENEYVGWYQSIVKNAFTGWFDKPTLLEVGSAKQYENLNISLKSLDAAKEELPYFYSPNVMAKPLESDFVSLGEVVEQESPIFSNERGKLGMWEPVKFYLEKNSGIFFLEPYAPAKIPVLYVHGLGGAGANWKYLIDQLDRNKYQPWISQYPSSMRLGPLSTGFNKSVTELQIRYKFKKLIVVSHSMGGLISRSFLNKNLSRNTRNLEVLFTTLATPWEGHTSAELGVRYAPTAIPAWYDLVPGSPFLKELLAEPLPSQVDFFLLFAYRNSNNFFSDENSDGVVTLHSQLEWRAQNQAKETIGFDEDHSGILSSEKVAKKLTRLMNEFYAK